MTHEFSARFNISDLKRCDSLIAPFMAAVKDPCVKTIRIGVDGSATEFLGTLAWPPSGGFRILAGLCVNEKVTLQLPPEPAVADKSFSVSLLVGTYIASEARTVELVQCLEKNLSNPFIGDVHLFVEDPVQQWEAWVEGSGNAPKPYESLRKLAALKHHKKVKIVPIGRRPFYSEYFQYAAADLPKRVVAISNSDIEYDATLGKLSRYDLSKVFISLSRESGRKGYSGAFDTWIFRPPVNPALFKCHWPLGTNGGEVKITYEAKAAGYCVLNPCMSIHTIHRHDALNRRTWTLSPRIKGPYGEAHPTGLEALLSKRRPS